MAKDIKCDVVKFYGVISETDKYEKVLADVSWNNRSANLELRLRNKETGNLEKGIKLSKDEIIALYHLIQSDHMVKGMDVHDYNRNAVDLDNVLDNIEEIVETRKDFATNNGIITLKRVSTADIHIGGKTKFRSL